jgi:uncharacterized protein YggE
MFRRSMAILGVSLASAGLLAAACSPGAAATPSGTTGTQPTATTPAGGVSPAPAGDSVAALAAAIRTGSNQQSGLWVTGQGIVNVTPDVAILTVGVEAQRPTVAQARSETADAMNKLFQALKARGVADKDIRTSQFSIYPVYRYDERGRQQVLEGYRVQNTVTVKVRNLNNAGPIIDEAVAAAGDLARVQGISFTLDDPTPMRDQARTLAVKQAVAKARQMATDAGITLGSVLLLTESGGFEAPPVPMKLEARAAADSATPISPGELQVQVTVQIVYEIR